MGGFETRPTRGVSPGMTRFFDWLEKWFKRIFNLGWEPPSDDSTGVWS